MKRRICAGGYETQERRLLPTFLEPGDRVLELGASVGIISAIALRIIGPSGRLVSVEADKNLATPFQKTLAANGLSSELVSCACVPIWDSNDKVDCFTAIERSGNSLEGRVLNSSKHESGAVPMRQAGDICRDLAFTPNAVICDIEGSERIWLQRAAAIPATVEKILVELHPWLDGPEIAGQTLAGLLQAGFQVRAFSGTVFDLRRRTF
jgi:FkbM family methyltransferase